MNNLDCGDMESYNLMTPIDEHVLLTAININCSYCLLLFAFQLYFSKLPTRGGSYVYMFIIFHVLLL